MSQGRTTATPQQRQTINVNIVGAWFFALCLICLSIVPVNAFAQQASESKGATGGYKAFKFGMSSDEVKKLISSTYHLETTESKSSSPIFIEPHTIRYTKLNPSLVAPAMKKETLLIEVTDQKAGEPDMFYFLGDYLVYIRLAQIMGGKDFHEDFYSGIKEKYSGRKYSYDGKYEGSFEGMDSHAIFGRNDTNVVWAETFFYKNNRSEEMIRIHYADPTFYDVAKSTAGQAASQQTETKKSVIE